MQPDVTSICRELIRDLDVELLEVRERWNSRFIVLRRQSVNGRKKLVLKVTHQSPMASAETGFHLLTKCAEFAEKRGIPPFAPAPHKLEDSRPHLCYEWIEGRELQLSIRERLHAGIPGSEIIELMAEAGRVLACFHLAAGIEFCSESTAQCVATSRKQDRHTRRAIRLLGETESPALRGGYFSQWCNDPGLHNMILCDDGRLMMVDLPETIRRSAIGYDLGMLLARVELFLSRELRRQKRFDTLTSLPYQARDACHRAYVRLLADHGVPVNERELRISFVRHYLLDTSKVLKHRTRWQQAIELVHCSARLLGLAVSARIGAAPWGSFTEHGEANVCRSFRRIGTP